MKALKNIDNKLEKIKVTSAKIIVTGTIKKPYYQIEYCIVDHEECYIGYGSYKLKFVFNWLNECFEIVN